MKFKIQIEEKDLQKVLSILHTHIPNVAVWVFGSRALGNAKQYSDLDIAIVHTQSLDPTLLMKLRLAFEESYLPFKVDIVEFASVSPTFQNIIQSAKVEIQSAKHN